MKSSQANVITSGKSCPPELDVAAFFGRLLLDYCAARGLTAEEVLAVHGLDPLRLGDPDSRIPMPVFLKLCCWAADRLNDHCLGLHVGANIEPRHLGPYGFALISASTGRELLTQASRYSGLAINAGQNVFVENDAECIRYWRSAIDDDVPGASLFCDLVMTTWVTMVRALLKEMRPTLNWATFRHAAPADDSDYRKIFGCPLAFGQADYALGFDRRFLDATLEQGHPQVAASMNSLCEAMLESLRKPREPEWLLEARRLIVELLKIRVPELQDVAAQLHIAPSTLRARLTKRELTFRQLIDDLRHDLAVAYLNERRLSLVDITYLLQYSEQSAFQRAFKRRAGCTPTEYRVHRMG